jgi:hypothetical protein
MQRKKRIKKANEKNKRKLMKLDASSLKEIRKIHQPQSRKQRGGIYNLSTLG